MFGDMTGNIHTLSDKSISQSKGRETKRGPQSNIVTFNDLDRVRYNRQLSKAETKEKKGDIILNVACKDGRYFLHPYFNSSGSTVFLNPEDRSKGLYEKNGKFYYDKTGGDTGNELKTFTKEGIEELKIKRTMGEKNFYERINETKLDKYFGKFKGGYTWGNANIGFSKQKEPMDSVRENKKKNNHINSTSTLTDESKSTGIDSNYTTYQYNTNDYDYSNLENSGYSFINQVDANSNNSHEDESRNQEYAEVTPISRKPNKQHNLANLEYAKVEVISNNNYGKNSGYSSHGYIPNAIYTEYYDYTPQYINSNTLYNMAYSQTYPYTVFNK